MGTKEHAYNFDGGDILYRMGAWWFVSYSYYLNIDNSYRAWDTTDSTALRQRKYEISSKFHKFWLQEVLKMEKLSSNNKGHVSAEETKRMAKELLDLMA